MTIGDQEFNSIIEELKHYAYYDKSDYGKYISNIIKVSHYCGEMNIKFYIALKLEAHRCLHYYKENTDILNNVMYYHKNI